MSPTRHGLRRAGRSRPDAAGQVDADLDGEVHAHASDGVAQVIELHIGIGTGVGDDDPAAVTADQFVQRRVFEVATVAEEDGIGIGAGETEGIAREGAATCLRHAIAPPARMRQPEAKAPTRGTLITKVDARPNSLEKRPMCVLNAAPEAVRRRCE